MNNSCIAELLARAADEVKAPMAAKALRKASRRSLSWEVEAQQLLEEDRSLTELEGVGPYIAKKLEGWIQNSPLIPEPPEERKDFLTLVEARSILSIRPAWKGSYRGDLQMHTAWSDGSGSIDEMAAAAIQRGYSYIAIREVIFFHCPLPEIRIKGKCGACAFSLTLKNPRISNIIRAWL